MYGGEEGLVRAFVGAFQALALKVGPECPPITVADFADACSKMPLMGQSGVSGKWTVPDYWKEEYMAKLNQLRDISRHETTLAELIDQDKANNSVRLADSNSRVLLRLSRSLQVIKVGLAELLKGRDVPLQKAAIVAYRTVFSQYHDMTTQKIVVASMLLLPTRAVFMDAFEGEEDSTIIEMRRFVDASTVVIEYIDMLFTSRELTTDW